MYSLEDQLPLATTHVDGKLNLDNERIYCIVIAYGKHITFYVEYKLLFIFTKYMTKPEIYNFINC